MQILRSVLEYLGYGLSLKQGWRELVNGIKWLDNWSSEGIFSDVDELTRAFRDGIFQDGAIIHVQGIFSEYTHSYRPYTYTPSIPSKPTITENNGHTTISADKYDIFQPPVEAFPEIQINGKTLSLGFLYPVEFQGFAYKPVSNSMTTSFLVGSNQPLSVVVPESAQPVPILYEPLSGLHTGEYCEAKAQVIPLPMELLLSISDKLGDWWEVFFRRITLLDRPTQKSMCLATLGNGTKLRRLEGTLESIPMSIYVEGIVDPPQEGIDTFSVVANAIPDRPKTRWGTGMAVGGDGITSIVTSRNIRCVYREPGVLGLYLSIDLVNGYQESIIELKDFVRLFDKQLQKSTDYKSKFYVTFISDKRLVPLLGLPRFMVGGHFNDMLAKHPELRSAYHWLK